MSALSPPVLLLLNTVGVLLLGLAETQEVLHTFLGGQHLASVKSVGGALPAVEDLCVVLVHLLSMSVELLLVGVQHFDVPQLESVVLGDALVQLAVEVQLDVDHVFFFF